MSDIYNKVEVLFQQPHTLPTIIITVILSVLIALYMDKNKQAHGHPGADSSEAPKPKPFAVPDTPLPAPNTSKIFSVEELSQFDGSKGEDSKIYVGIKGTVFDVSAKKAMYGPGAGYSVFAGKDASKALGKSSLKPEDCIADYSELNETERKTLDDWYIFFEKRYAIVGKTA
ncbi:hypothetical protein BGZ76_002412 [Entomortierella beljakovae]|nr:hypothetical protein BGZ76_002412 [Entomortierella beljakovae]